MVGTVGRDAVGARLRARSLDGPDAVVVTLGAEGALVAAARLAVRVAAATTLRPGAMEALPTRDEVDRLLADGAR